MTALIITCFNRSEELRQTLNSLHEADLSDVLLILINDASTDEDTNKQFEDFNVTGIPILKHLNTKNQGIKLNLKYGYEKAFEMCEFAINLDSDTLVKKDFVKKLLNLKRQFPENIITGFNCETKSLNGAERHPVIERGKGWIKKRSVGGVNMLMNKKEYEKWMLPTLSVVGNWDANTCINSLKDGKPIIATSPSVVQHIGFKSSMGHTGVEPPDVADDFDEKINLLNVTLIGVDSIHPDLLKKAADISQRNINFGAVKLITDKNIRSKEEYCKFVIKELYRYVETSHLLLIQHDGYVLNYKAWDNEFLKYDYIGATWWFKDNMNVGNGGFSLRSKVLMEIVAQDPLIANYFPEDEQICRLHRKRLEKELEIKFAPEEVANRFSIEAWGNSAHHGGKKYNGAFGFHGYNIDFTNADLPHIPKRPVEKKSEHEIKNIEVHSPSPANSTFFRW